MELFNAVEDLLEETREKDSAQFPCEYQSSAVFTDIESGSVD